MIYALHRPVTSCIVCIWLHFKRKSESEQNEKKTIDSETKRSFTWKSFFLGKKLPFVIRFHSVNSCDVCYSTQAVKARACRKNGCIFFCSSSSSPHFAKFPFNNGSMRWKEMPFTTFFWLFGFDPSVYCLPICVGLFFVCYCKIK